MKKDKPIVVMKFGGTSVGDPDNPSNMTRMRMVAEFIRAAAIDHQVAVVVSAMGHTTDIMVDQMHQVNPKPPERELDQLLHIGETQSAALLAAALHTISCPARSMTGQQMRLVASGDHGKGRIIRIDGVNEMKRLLANDEVLVCAGFQGVDEQSNVITLGRGGSDTSAVALAHALNAEGCDIFTDVDGVYAVDPRIVPNAKKFGFVSFSDMLAMSAAGAGVLMDRAVALARDHNVPLRVLLSPSKGQSSGGTLVAYRPLNSSIEDDNVSTTGLAIRKNVAVINIGALDNAPGVAAAIFDAVKGVVIGDAIQGHAANQASLSFWIDLADQEQVLGVLQDYHPNINTNCACLTLVCPNMKEGQGYLARLTKALADTNVNIEMIASAGIGILVIVNADKLSDAAQAIAHEFELSS